MKRIKKIFRHIVMASSLLTLFGCGSSNYAPLDTVESVDVMRYLGKWYEIAKFPNSFQKNIFGATAEYSLIDSTTIRVINSGFKDSLNGDVNRATGKAYVVENTGNAKLRVQFFWPFRGDYWILELDKDKYSYVVVGEPSRKYLWILAREPKLDDAIYNMLVEKCRQKGFDVSKLEKTTHRI